VPIQILETDGSVTIKSYLNGGAALTAGAYYTFVIEARNKDAPGGPTGNPNAYNVVVTGGASTFPVCRVTEVVNGPD
jgi:hypothetical protein